MFFKEKSNENCIYLYKEGSFWKSYEHSAWLFVRYVRPYQTKKRFYKNIRQEIVSIGFPDVTLEDILKNRKILDRKEKEVVLEIEPEEGFNEEVFLAWKDMCSVQEKVQINESEDKHEDVVKLIRTFSLVNSTPLDCMQFISELQKRI